jgi:hypothetical protein
MSPARFFLAFATLVALPAACADGSRIVDTSTGSVSTPRPQFPAITRPGTIYRAPDAPIEHASPSQYVLYDDGTFALQSLQIAYVISVSEYVGRYTRTGSVVTFYFDRSNELGDWEATGMIRLNELTVTYNVAALEQFSPATYLQVSAAP